MGRNNKLLIDVCCTCFLVLTYSCTYDVSSFEKKDVVGSWESDSVHYVVHLFDNDSCVISNIPRNVLCQNRFAVCESVAVNDSCVISNIPRNIFSEEDKNDTTRIDVCGKWEIWDWNDCISITLMPMYESGTILHVQGCFFSGKSKWKLFSEFTDDNEIPYRHTYSRVSPVGKCNKLYEDIR